MRASQWSVTNCFSWFLRFFAGIALGLTLAACQAPSDDTDADDQTDSEAQEDSNNKNEDEVESTPLPVEVDKVTVGQVAATYATSATIESERIATITAKVAGEISRLMVEEGDTVKPQQALAELDGQRLKLQLDRAKADYNKAKKEWERNVELHQRGLLAEGAFEAQRFDLDALKAAQALAQLEYDYTTIRSPIGGIVTQRMANIGNSVNIGESLFEVVDLGALVAYIYLPEIYFNNISIGQTVAMNIDVLADTPLEAEIIRVASVIDSDNGTFKVTVDTSKSGEILRPGMFARFRMIYDQRDNVMLVPRKAVVDEETEPALFVVENNKVVRKPVSLGYSQGAQVEIIDGVEQGETIVVKGFRSLRDGSEVEIIEFDQPSN